MKSLHAYLIGRGAAEDRVARVEVPSGVYWCLASQQFQKVKVWEVWSSRGRYDVAVSSGQDLRQVVVHAPVSEGAPDCNSDSVQDFVRHVMLIRFISWYLYSGVVLLSMAVNKNYVRVQMSISVYEVVLKVVPTSKSVRCSGLFST